MVLYCVHRFGQAAVLLPSLRKRLLHLLHGLLVVEELLLALLKISLELADRDGQFLDLLAEGDLLLLLFLELLDQLELLGVELAYADFQLNESAFKAVILPVLFLHGLLEVADLAVTLFVLFGHLARHVFVVAHLFILVAKLFLNLFQGALQSLEFCFVLCLHLALGSL